MEQQLAILHSRNSGRGSQHTDAMSPIPTAHFLTHPRPPRRIDLRSVCR